MGANGSELDLSDVSDDSPLVRLLETRSRVKVLDALVRHSYAALTEGEIAEFSGVDQSTVNRNLPVIIDLGLVRRVEEWPARYQLVQDHPVVEGLEKMQLYLMGDSDRLKQSDVPRRGDDQDWETPTPTRERIRRLMQSHPDLVSELYHEVHGVVQERQRPAPQASTAA